MDERKEAVALRYNQDKDSAPTIVAKGYGVVADNLLSLANQHSVPVYQNKTLSGILMTMEIDREIPTELYQAVAEVLAYVYRVDSRLENKRG